MDIMLLRLVASLSLCSDLCDQINAENAVNVCNFHMVGGEKEA